MRIRERKVANAGEAVAAAHSNPIGLKGDARYTEMAKIMDMDAKPQGAKWHWSSRLKVINGWFGGFRVGYEKGRRLVSHATRDDREKRLFQCFKQLWELGFRIEHPSNLASKHIVALVEFWTGQRAMIIKMGKVTRPIFKIYSPKTIENWLSALRTLCGWLGKNDVVMPKKFYATEAHPLKCTGIAQEDKSWEAANIDFKKIMQDAFDEDSAVATQLMVMSVFGLRIKEAVMFNVYDSDRGSSLYIKKGAKGGRPRSIEITTVEQRETLELVKGFMRLRSGVDHLGSTGRDLEQALQRSYYILKKIGITKKNLGVTAHGLRHGFCQQLMVNMGLIPAIKGGLPDQMTKEERTRIERAVSEALGHTRPSITTAYGGSFYSPQLKITSFNVKDMNNDPR